MKKLTALLFFLLLSSRVFAIQDIYVIHFVLDGLRYDVLEKELKAGNLPNLQKDFYDQGAVFEQAIATFPTVSSPGYISFATGLSAGNSGVFFLEWFDRTKAKPVGYLTLGGFNRVNTDLMNRVALHDPEIPQLYSPLTIFEKLSPEPSAAIYTPFRRGASIAIPKKFPFKAMYSGLIAKDGFALNQQAMQEVEKLFSKTTNKIPRYALVALYGPDNYGHKTGPFSEELAWDLKQFDSLFKQFLAKLEERGLKDKTYIILSADHGMHETGKLLNLKEDLFQHGVQKTDKIYISNRGVSSTFVYAAGNEGWPVLPSVFHLRNFPTKKKTNIDLIKILYENPSVEWIAARDRLDRVRIYNKDGEAVITQTMIGDQTYYSYSYRLSDPFDYVDNPRLKPYLNDKPYPAQTWFEATAKENFPNAVVEISHLFKDPRAGDILVVAKAPWGFRTIKAGTHGSLNQDDMHIPLWIKGPGIPQGHFGNVRGVDLYPTILSWFGIRTDIKNQEGQVLFVNSPAPVENSLAATLASLEQEMMNRPRLNKVANKQELIRKLKQRYPQATNAEIKRLCKAELERRYQQWKKLDNLMADPKQKPDMHWLLVHERNLEYERLRRMEDVESILENPLQ